MSKAIGVEQQDRRKIDQVSQALGELRASYHGMKEAVDTIVASHMKLVADSADRRALIEAVNSKVDVLVKNVAKLNDVDRKLGDMGFRLDDAKSHRQDQLFVRRARRAIEFLGRHIGKTLVMAVIGGLLAVILSNYPHAEKFVLHFIEG